MIGGAARPAALSAPNAGRTLAESTLFVEKIRPCKCSKIINNTGSRRRWVKHRSHCKRTPRMDECRRGQSTARICSQSMMLLPFAHFIIPEAYAIGHQTSRSPPAPVVVNRCSGVPLQKFDAMPREEVIICVVFSPKKGARIQKRGTGSVCSKQRKMLHDKARALQQRPAAGPRCDGNGVEHMVVCLEGALIASAGPEGRSSPAALCIAEHR